MEKLCTKRFAIISILYYYIGRVVCEKESEFMSNSFETQKFTNQEKSVKSQASLILSEVYNSLTEKGYNPTNQIVGYILSGDPTYITSHKNARTLISKVERDELLEEIVNFYLDNI